MAKLKSREPIGWKYKLLHRCLRKGCEGWPGDEKTLDAENHEWFQANVVPSRGAKLLSVVYADGEQVEHAMNEPVAELR